MNIENILAHAQQVMLNENFWAKVDASTPGTTNAKSREAKMFKENRNVQPAQQLQFTPQRQVTANSKIDKSILESFQKTPSMSGVINGGDYAGDIPASYFAGLNGNTVTSQTSEKELPNIQYQRKPAQLNETIQTTGQYVPQASSAVDYNYIKYLIDESLKSYFGNNKLNESVNGLAGLKMSGGNKIHFIDTKGNIYEATLTLKKKKS